MKSIFLQCVALSFQALIVRFSIVLLGALLWEPHLEGRNIHANPFEVYFNDPFLAYIYAAFIFFFVALYQSFRLLGFIRRHEVYSPRAVRALRIITYCTAVHASLIAAAVVFIFVTMRGKDDIAGGVAVGLFITVVSTGIALAAILLRRYIQKRLS